MRIFLLGATPSLDFGCEDKGVGNARLLTSAEKLKKTGGNTGNQIIAYGLLKGIEYTAVGWNHAIGPTRVNAEYDMIVIAAANFLHSGFDFTGMADFLEKTTLPVVMIGVGAQASAYSQEIVLRPGTERLMRIVAERSKLVGVRGKFTAEVLHNLNIENVQIVGCPSYYMNGRAGVRISRESQLDVSARIAINGSRDVVRHSFDKGRMESLLRELFSEGIRRGGDFIAQTETPEIDLADEREFMARAELYEANRVRLEQFAGLADDDEIKNWFLNHMRVFWDVPSWARNMARYDFVVGTRFHGNLLGLQSGTAAFTICHDTRTTEMCEFLGMPHAGILEINNIDLDAMYAQIDPEALAARYAQLYPEYLSFLSLNGLKPRLI